METKPVSVQQQKRVLEMHDLLATGIEQLILFYFDLLLHGYIMPGSTDITCFLCDEFNFSKEPMIWSSIYQGRHYDDVASWVYCKRCEFHFTFPCASLRSEEIMDTMITIARNDADWDEK